MEDRTVELAVGETLRVGDHWVTVIEIDGDEVTLRVDDSIDEQTVSGEYDVRLTRPR